MIIYSQSQSHYENAKKNLKAGDLCFIDDEKKIIFHKNAKGEGAVVYEGTDTDTNTEVVKYIKAAVGIANTLDYDLSDYISSENSFIVRNIYKKPASDLTGDTISTDANSILFVNTCPKDDNLHYYNAILFTHNGSIYTGKTNKTNLKDLQGNLKRLAFYSELSDYSLTTHTHDLYALDSTYSYLLDCVKLEKNPDGSIYRRILTGRTDVEGNINTAYNVNVDGQLKAGGIYLNNNQVNLDSNYSLMVINYTRSGDTLSSVHICDGLTKTIAEFKSGEVKLYDSSIKFYSRSSDKTITIKPNSIGDNYTITIPEESGTLATRKYVEDLGYANSEDYEYLLNYISKDTKTDDSGVAWRVITERTKIEDSLYVTGTSNFIGGIVTENINSASYSIGGTRILQYVQNSDGNKNYYISEASSPSSSYWIQFSRYSESGNKVSTVSGDLNILRHVYVGDNLIFLNNNYQVTLKAKGLTKNYEVSMPSAEGMLATLEWVKSEGSANYLSTAKRFGDTGIDWDLSEYMANGDSFIVSHLRKESAKDLTGDTFNSNASSILFINSHNKDGDEYYYNAVLFGENGRMYTCKTGTSNVKDLKGKLNKLAFTSDLNNYALTTHTHDYIPLNPNSISFKSGNYTTIVKPSSTQDNESETFTLPKSSGVLATESYVKSLGYALNTDYSYLTDYITKETDSSNNLYHKLNTRTEVGGDFKVDGSINSSKGVTCGSLTASGEINFSSTTGYVKTGHIWLLYNNRITLSGDQNEEDLLINYSCYKTGEGNINKNTVIYDGCGNRIVAFKPNEITLYKTERASDYSLNPIVKFNESTAAFYVNVTLNNSGLSAKTISTDNISIDSSNIKFTKESKKYTLLSFNDPTAENKISFPNSSGTLATKEYVEGLGYITKSTASESYMSKLPLSISFGTTNNITTFNSFSDSDIKSVELTAPKYSGTLTTEEYVSSNYIKNNPNNITITTTSSDSSNGNKISIDGSNIIFTKSGALYHTLLGFVGSTAQNSVILFPNTSGVVALANHNHNSSYLALNPSLIEFKDDTKGVTLKMSSDIKKGENYTLELPALDGVIATQRWANSKYSTISHDHGSLYRYLIDKDILFYNNGAGGTIKMSESIQSGETFDLTIPVETGIIATREFVSSSYMSKTPESINIGKSGNSNILYLEYNSLIFNSKNGYTSLVCDSINSTADIIIPNKSGTIALRSDIPDISLITEYITTETEEDWEYYSLNGDTIVDGIFGVYGESQFIGTANFGDIYASDSIHVTGSFYAGNNSQTGYVRLYEKGSLNYTEFNKSNLTIASDVNAFEITGNTKVTGTLSVPKYISTGEVYVENNYVSSALRALNDSNSIDLGGDFNIKAYSNASGNLTVAGNVCTKYINTSSDSSSLAINYDVGKNVNTVIYNGLKTAIASFVAGNGLQLSSGVSCTYITATGEANLKGEYIKTSLLWLEYSNRLTVSGNRDEAGLNINYSCYKTGTGEVNKNTYIYDGCRSLLASFETDKITLNKDTEIVGGLSANSLSILSLYASSVLSQSLSIGNVSVLDSCVSVGDVHVYNEDLSYSDLVGSIQEVELLNFGQTLHSSCSYSYVYNLNKGDILNLNGGEIYAVAMFEAPSSSASASFIYKVSATVNGSLVAQVRAGSTIYSNNSTTGKYSGTLGTDSYEATESCQVTVTIEYTLTEAVSCVIDGKITKSPSSGANTTLLSKNAIGLLYDSLNYFIVGMDNGVMKMTFVSGGTSMFDSTYSNNK